MSTSKPGSSALWLVSGIAIAALGAFAAWRLGSGPTPSSDTAAIYPSPKALPAVELTDETGQTFPVTAASGHYTFLFFGYTNCPDVCPTTLAEISAALKQLTTPKALAPQVLFVSVDPERDPPPVLARYVNHFGPAFHGATGSDEALTTLTRAVGALYVRGTPVDGSYSVDHTAAVFLLDPRGRLVAVLPAPHEAKRLASDYARIVKRAGGDR